MNSGFRSMTPLPGGGESGTQNIAKAVRVLGCKMEIASGVLTTKGNPTGGQFRLVFDGHKSDACNFDASASDVQTVLESLASELSTLDSTHSKFTSPSCTGGPLPGGSITITFSTGSVKMLTVEFGKLTGGIFDDADIPDSGESIFCGTLNKDGENDFPVVEAVLSSPNWADDLRSIAIKNHSTWYLPSLMCTLSATAAEDFTDGEGNITLLEGPDGERPGVSDTTDYEVTDTMELYAFPRRGKWVVSPKNCPE